jgi:uncharacterized Ntn-hydrolase superfamily protein
MNIIFEGTREECFALEYALRPRKGIGWNRAIGGQQGFRIGFTHSDKTRERLRSKWTEERKVKASSLKKKLNQKLRGQKRPKQSAAMSGKNNPIYGTKRPQYVIDAMVKAHKGKPSSNRQELYCIKCHKRTSYSRLLRYHNKCSII